MRSILLFGGLCLSGLLSAQSDFATTTAHFGDLRARQIGPATMSGRVSCLAVHPGDAATVYIGAGGGGVWKTTNNGATLQPVFDDHVQSIGAIALAPADPQTVYVGTGEPWVRNSVSIGDGVYRSRDGGNRWQHIGLDSTERIAAIVVHPKHPDTLYVAALGPLWSDGTQRGVFRSTNGGADWDRVLYLDEATGAASLSMHPEDPNILFAAMWSHRRYPHTFDSGFTGRSGLYRSRDGGESWELLSEGLPAETLGRIGVAVAPGNGEVVYASVETGSKETKGLYRSEDGGDTWSLVDRTFPNQIRPFYFAQLAVDPSNDSIVVKCGLSAVITQDAGNSWRTFDQSVHSDAHDIYIDPADGRHILVATDGGVYESFDRGYTFKMWQNLPVSQFYHVSVDNADPYRIYGGLQDNGSWYGPSSQPGGIQNSDWRKTLGGDGFYSFRHPTQTHYVFSEYQGGNLARFDERTGRAKSITPYPDTEAGELRFNWSAPLHLSADGERLYFASQYLFLSTDAGDSWQRISPDLTTNDTSLQQQWKSGGLSIDNSGAENHTTVYAVAESPSDPNIIWAGTDDGNLQVTLDGGDSWNLVNPASEGPPQGSWVTFIDASPHDSRTALVTFDNHRRGDMATYLYRTTDAGQNWERLNGEAVRGYALSVRQDPKQPTLLYLGTEFGLYLSLDGGDSWAPFRNQVPQVGIRDMVIHPEQGDLILATHGRGVIILDDLEALRQVGPGLDAAPITFLERDTFFFSERGAAGGNEYGGGGMYRGPNPSDDLNILYYANRRHTFGKMFVNIYHEGKLIRTLQAGKGAGLNVVSLPTTLEKPKAPPSDNRSAQFGTMYGPRLPAGAYQVALVKGRDTFQTEIVLAVDPESPYTENARADQYALLMQLFSDSEELAYLHEVLERVWKQAKEADLSDLAQRAAALQANIVFTGGDGYVDEGEKIGEKVSQLYSAVSSFPGRPSASQRTEGEELHRQVEALGAEVRAFTEGLSGHDIAIPTKEAFLAADN
ncbi:photosystem II stability/assembly factor-like uncharacterized protein [Neolewinella xylanilytica]|uniref:Photosystem II stability/assembly factor-like uncharacterized protein n=1 Tax=Neolewinella xylanilytica TaxID=1514080 RepID=A0A2S6IB69_9BACT|nr:hypothetical protein [Neolewinella xylanilytica]PPK88725.1 photosystem II stability/assembly factor-like uncharacterized protein [Neolewinella xylanilytica]